MSVLFKSANNIGNIGGGSNKGFPPGDVSNIIRTVNDSKILIKWTDPDDTIIDGITIAKWKGTILVRNSDHYPTSINDGGIVIDNTTRNKYKDNYYEDNNLTNNTTYYYRFFPYSEDKVYNDSSNMIFKNKPLPFDPILKNNTWEKIANAVKSGNIPDTWNIGDEIDLVLKGTLFNETVTLQIWNFNHFDKSNGSGKANICFGTKHLMKDTQQMNPDSYNNPNATNNGGWNNTSMRNTIMNAVFNSMPIELRNAIKEVNIYANKGGGSRYSEQGLLSKDKVFLPGLTECDNEWEEQNKTETGQKKFPIFTDYESRRKKLNNGSGSAVDWWARSPHFEDNFHFCGFYAGGASSYYYAGNNYGVCFCFNI